jgi:hypothetical protein
MIKYVLTIEFRYDEIPKNEYFSGCETEKFTIKEYENLKDAIKEGNDFIKNTLKKHFEIKKYDYFGNQALGLGTLLLVSNCCYRDNVSFSAKIEVINTPDNIENEINRIREINNKWIEYRRKENENGI